jgi:glycosyltransferase involved in cell wall biosynthesis
MKLLVFAHTPPPHHGQSYMVQLMLAGFGGDQRAKARRGQQTSTGSQDLPATPQAIPPSVFPGIGEEIPNVPPASLGIECYHVNTRLSHELEDIGDVRLGKFLLLLGYCLEALWCRYRYGVMTFYYIPAPGKPSALYRDWLVMLLCRPFFKTVILHWHAAGLAKWLETAVQIRSRAWTYYFMKRVDLSIVLSKYNRADAEKLYSRQIKVVSNGIPDPCPAYAEDVLPRRHARAAARQKLLSGQPITPAEAAACGGQYQVVQVLYLAHCTREKGLFDAIAGVMLANEQLAARRALLSLRLLVAGTFVSPAEKQEFELILQQPRAAAQIEGLGFVSGEWKNQLLREADIFCFPTFYQNENQPVNLIEAMAFGLPILTTRWRSIPELFPSEYPGLVDIRSPQQIAQALITLMARESGEVFREIFLRQFTLERHLAALAEAMHSVEQPRMSPVPPTALPVTVR